MVNGIAVGQVSGNHATNPLWTSHVDSMSFQKALVQSLKEANLYHEVDGTKYTLNVNLIRLQQPVVGLDYTVMCEINYQLQDAHSKATVYDNNVVSTYTATFHDSPLWLVRQKLANEGAARANIRQFIDELYQLPKFKR